VELSVESFREGLRFITSEAAAPPPLPTPSPRLRLISANEADLSRTRQYLEWCGGEDCAGVLDGGVFTEEARASFALHVALSGALNEAAGALGSITPTRVRAALTLAILVSTGLMMAPEPFSKLLAITLACNLIAFLGVDLFNHVVLGYLEMRKAANATRRFDELVAVGRWYSRQLGPSIARVAVMLATFGIARAASVIPPAPMGLPGAALAAANAGAAGLPLGQLAAVQGVAVAADGTITVSLAGAVAMVPGKGAGKPGGASLDEEPSAEKLDRALKAAGEKKPPGTAVHHIVAGKAPLAEAARKVLRKFGIGINDASNGVYLPCNSRLPCDAPGAIHSQIHTEKYFKAVELALRRAATREEVIEILRAIAAALKAGGYP